jgi:hypothetical protein
LSFSNCVRKRKILGSGHGSFDAPESGVIVDVKISSKSVDCCVTVTSSVTVKDRVSLDFTC